MQKTTAQGNTTPLSGSGVQQGCTLPRPRGVTSASTPQHNASHRAAGHALDAGSAVPPDQPCRRSRHGHVGDKDRIGAVYMHAIDSHHAERRVTAAATFGVARA
jgi:hypothetical protein